MIDPLFKRRRKSGFYYASVQRSTSEKFRNYYRMTATQFEELLHLVTPAISKQTIIKESLPPAERLSITLRFVFIYNFSSLIQKNYLLYQIIFDLFIF